MATNSLIPFEKEHIEHIELREGQSTKAQMLNGLSYAVLLDAWTLMHGDVVVGCGGVRKVREGVGEVWLILSKHFDDLPISSVKAIAVKLYQYEAKFHRIQATVYDIDVRAKHFIEWLGFEHEGIMREYVKGRDCHLYALVR